MTGCRLRKQSRKFARTSKDSPGRRHPKNGRTTAPSGRHSAACCLFHSLLPRQAIPPRGDLGRGLASGTRWAGLWRACRQRRATGAALSGSARQNVGGALGAHAVCSDVTCSEFIRANYNDSARLCASLRRPSAGICRQLDT